MACFFLKFSPRRVGWIFATLKLPRAEFMQPLIDRNALVADRHDCSIASQRHHAHGPRVSHDMPLGHLPPSKWNVHLFHIEDMGAQDDVARFVRHDNES
jgi:hypothetical protein